jgi:rod shape-determining protein MreD
VLGLLVDIVALHRLGVHALLFTLVAYILHLTHKKMSISSMEKQTLTIFLILLGIRSLKAAIDWYISGHFPSVLYFFPVFTTTLLWPIFSKIVLQLSLRR